MVTLYRPLVWKQVSNVCMVEGSRQVRTVEEESEAVQC